MIKGVSTDNSEFLVVGRIEILAKRFDVNKNAVILTVRRNKNLTIENYADSRYTAPVQ